MPGHVRELTLGTLSERGGASAVIPIPPGTHHIKFVVDGEMLTSPDLPTTVDFSNILVNYIEVNPDDVPPPGISSESTEKPSEIGKASSVIQTREPLPTEERQTAGSDSALAARKAAMQMKSPKSYSATMPRYLMDLDSSEDSSSYHRAIVSIEKLPTPPSLPGFLGKSILNGITPMKDDNSVLIFPNHTVLNHLATSSIKNNVLAVSATTRYKRKVGTFQILHAYKFVLRAR
jgi:hypothetical protein